jgi:arylsulfatase A-like enzyme
MRSRPGILALAFVLAGGIHSAGGADERPNVVLLVADDMDFEHFGFAAHPLAETPTLDGLAGEGVLFTHGFVPMSRCRPAQAALLSGRWPHQNGVYFNVGADHIDPATALPNLLARAGYGTLGEGKFWEFEARAMGFSNYTIRNYETFVRWDQQHLFEWLDAQDRARPFFVWWAPELPHVPHDPPERLLARIPLEAVPVPDWFEGDEAARAEFRARERVLLAMDAWLDEGVAELVTKLKALGEHEDTLYVFLVDNGWANGCVSKGWGLDKGLRTPLILSWKKGIAGGARHVDLVSPVDLYATILDLAGAPIPAGCEGQSLRARLAGEPGTPRAALYGALYPLEPSAPLADAARDAYGLWARTERWKYILALKDLHAVADAGSAEGEREDIKVSLAPDFVRKRGEVELYDLEHDPHERVNLAGRPEHAELLARLRADTLAWWRATGGGPLDVP